MKNEMMNRKRIMKRLKIATSAPMSESQLYAALGSFISLSFVSIANVAEIPMQVNPYVPDSPHLDW